MKFLQKIDADSFSTLFDYDTPKLCMNKRLSKSITRTVDYSSEVLAMKKVGFQDFFPEYVE